MPRTVLVTRHCTTVARPEFRVFCEIDLLLTLLQAIAEGHGDAALLLLKAGAESNKRDVDEQLAINLAPDTKVLKMLQRPNLSADDGKQIRKFILQEAEREGIDVVEE